MTRAELRAREREQKRKIHEENQIEEHEARAEGFSREQARKRTDWEIGGSDDYDTTPFINHRP